ncbi:dihydrofolate reductase [Aestuariimicrobium kwangyangense]|uniref:dihydrofolate reductase n=1 Tax=Aestuariimicrobium TaxID=396388 RepID=UPI0003B752E9|nr:hypothetical protein AESSP_01854 [Aestuariimicrobium sp. T2.26MG-19.2B]
MQIISIAAVAENQVIGDGSRIPWHLPEDWARFKERTTGNFLVMGRETFEQIGRPLPNRTTIVVTRNPDWQAPAGTGATRVLVANSIEGAIELARTDRMQARDDTVFVAGGAQIYEQSMELVTGLDITEVHQSPDGDARFPEIRPEQWAELSREPQRGFDFVRYAPVTVTDRLELRPATPVDVDDWFALHSDPAAFPFAPDGPITTTEEAENELGEYLASWLNRGLGYWLARERDTGDLVGAGGMRAIRLPNGDSVWKLYYRLVPAKTGQGFTAELVRAAVEQLARIDRYARVRAVMRADNADAIAVVDNLGLAEHGRLVNEAGQEQIIYQSVVKDLI